MDRLAELFCLMDDFCRRFELAFEQSLLTAGAKKPKRRSELSLSELMTLAVLFHQMRFHQFKIFYLDYACRYLQAPSQSMRAYPELRLIQDCHDQGGHHPLPRHPFRHSFATCFPPNLT
jgi:hypothetical protein